MNPVNCWETLLCFKTHSNKTKLNIIFDGFSKIELSLARQDQIGKNQSSIRMKTHLECPRTAQSYILSRAQHWITVELLMIIYYVEDSDRNYSMFLSDKDLHTNKRPSYTRTSSGSLTETKPKIILKSGSPPNASGLTWTISYGRLIPCLQCICLVAFKSIRIKLFWFVIKTRISMKIRIMPKNCCS